MIPVQSGRGLLQGLAKSSWAVLRSRRIHTTNKLLGAPHGEDPIKNFEDFKWPNQVTTFEHYRLPQPLLDTEFNHPVCHDTMDIRWPGYWFKKEFVHVKEMEPELIVPDLEGFQLKPYVSYNTEDVDVKPFTAKELFEAVYLPAIAKNYMNNSMEEYVVKPEEIDEARLKAIQTGADLFEEEPLDGVRAPPEWRDW